MSQDMSLYLCLILAVISVCGVKGCRNFYNLDDGDVVITDQGTGAVRKCKHIVKASTPAFISVKCETFNFPSNNGKCRKEWMQIKEWRQKRQRFCAGQVPDFTTSGLRKKVVITTKGRNFDYRCTVTTSNTVTVGPLPVTTTKPTPGPVTTASPGSAAELNYTGCGIQGDLMRIVGGQDADVGEWPWQVYLGGCGGTILTDRCVLTAAHCIGNSMLNGGFTVYAGVDDRRNFGSDPNVQARVAEKAIRHPNYTTCCYADVAVIKLRTPFNFTSNAVNSACLPTEGLTYAGEDGTATGFGLTSAGGSMSNILQEAEYTIHANSDSICRNVNEYILCAADENKGTCNGDSGGPIVVEGSDDKWSIVGVNSYGVTSTCINPDYFQRVTYYMDFIRANCG